jgi:hypothetical protein
MPTCGTTCAGRIVFVIVPVALWLLFAVIVHRRGFWGKLLPLIAGRDNRLSLSRAQALTWSLVIFGSYAAAMAIHTPLRPARAEEVRHSDSLAVQARIRQRAAEDDFTRKAADTVNAARATSTARRDSAEAAIKADAGAEDGPRQLARAEVALRVAQAREAIGRSEVRLAEAAVNAASADTRAAELRVAELDWVEIPGVLLLLAGLTIGSGVLSSLISSATGENKTVCVLRIGEPTAAELAGWSLSGQAREYLAIGGKDFGSTGRVRFGRVPEGRRLVFAVNDFANTPVWEDQRVVARLPSAADYNVLVVDSPNGKVAFSISGGPAGFTLGPARTWYEASDLFRDDKSPDHFDIMKFQMFGWTLIAVGAYVGQVWTSLSPTLTSLPAVDESIVALTGVSLAAYLGSKSLGK